MSDYKPEPWTIERIREAFIYDGGEAEYHDPINGAREQRRMAGAIFDAWLADYAAEVAAKALTEAGIDPDDGWEYGLYEEDPHRERERPHRAYNGAHLVSENRAHVESQWRKGHPSIKFVRRRKAGPWTPVHTNGDRDA